MKTCRTEPQLKTISKLDEDSQISGYLDNDCDQVLEIEGDDDLENSENEVAITDGQNDPFQAKDCPQPLVGMEFESYDDAYNYYNCYAKELGFAIRVKSSWTKRNSKEKRGAVLCCNCEGFKTIKEVNSRRKETRTGCLAMIRLRLVESNRWRVDEVKLEHNHFFDLERAHNSKSHKKMEVGAKRKAEPTFDVEVQTIKLYRTPVIDPNSHGSLNSNESDINNNEHSSKCLRLKQGDAQVIHDYFFRMQLTNPNFFYLMDLNDEGQLRNVFWIESRSRAAYSYFDDVVAIDKSCLSKKCQIPILAFVGTNHHEQSVLLGCGLVADETPETYIWLFRAWLTCMSGRPPQTIISDQCKALQSSISEVFPRAHHRICFSYIMRSVVENLGESSESEAFLMVLNNIVYNCLKVDEFEIAWEDMVQRFEIRDHELLQSLYEDRERWVPAYSKDTLFAGMSSLQQGEFATPFFDEYVDKHTSLKEFFDSYELILQNRYHKEVLNDFESRDSIPTMKTRYIYELQLSDVYTKEIFKKFQYEVEMMSSCFGVEQVNTNGSIITYMIKEQVSDGNLTEVRNFEVMYDKAGIEIRCICSCFNFKGYLCRHALCILNYNGIEEVPGHYILSRWRKDIKRLYAPRLGSDNVDITNPVQWFEHLYRRAIQVVEEGMTSQDQYMVAWQAFKESLNKMKNLGNEQVLNRRR